MIYRTRSDIVKAVECQSTLHVGGSKSRLYYCTAWIIKPDFFRFSDSTELFDYCCRLSILNRHSLGI